MIPVLVMAMACLWMNGGWAGSVRSVPSGEAGKPVCAPGAICFSGEVSAGKEFRQALNGDLAFVLAPADSGWTIQIVPLHPQPDCDEFASVVTPPYRGHSDLDIDMSYGVSAEDEAADSPRQFSFVTNCRDFKTEFDRLQIVLWPYSFTEQQVDKATAALGTSPLGTGRVWLTSSTISHTADTAGNKLGDIESMHFTVEIRLPKPRLAPAIPAAGP